MLAMQSYRHLDLLETVDPSRQRKRQRRDPRLNLELVVTPAGIPWLSGEARLIVRTKDVASELWCRKIKEPKHERIFSSMLILQAP